MGVYLSAKFEVSSIFLTSFRQGVILPPLPPPPQNEALKGPPRLGLNAKLSNSQRNKLKSAINNESEVVLRS